MRPFFLLFVSAAVGWTTGLFAAPAMPMVNHIGRVPVRGVSEVAMKFAIVEYTTGIPATATATVSGGVVTALVLDNPGAGYVAAPSVTLKGGGGSGAKAAATLTNGQISSFTITNGGHSYERAPNVNIQDPPRAPAVATLWSNDGTSIAGSVPGQAVSLQVVGGNYSALLGYTGLPHMAALPREVLTHLEARVRVWYSTGKSFRQIVPDVPLANTPYAETASLADEVTGGTGIILPGSITTEMLAPGAVTAEKIAGGAVTVDKLGGAASGSASLGRSPLVASVQAGDAQLLARGFSQVRAFPAPDWITPSATGGPSGRTGESALWTGTSLLVWGGTAGGTLTAQGSAYTPSTNTWSTLPPANAPAARSGHTAVWTGTQMIVWGGATQANSDGSETGGLYDPAARTWQATASGGPEARRFHTAVWAGDRMLVFGGSNASGVLGNGGTFTPGSAGSTGAWSALPASTIAGTRRSHTAIWTGTRMIVWGGLDGDLQPLATGASLDPVSGTWTALPALNAPSARFGHAAVWTGSKMIVFGGAGALTDRTTANVFNDGGIFDPATQIWMPLPATGAPERRLGHDAVWTGAEMLVFGGEGVGGTLLTSAGAYSPTRTTWRTLPSAPAGATRPVGAWSGSSLLTFTQGGLVTLDPAPALFLYGLF